MPSLADVPVTVITVSDRRAAGQEDDTTGPLLADAWAQLGAAVTSHIVPDGIESVTSALTAAITAGSRLIVTTGGTGVAPRDLTPEATAPLLTQYLPGIPELLRREGAQHTPMAAVSRGLAGVSAPPERALIINLPGSPGAVREAIATLTPLLPHLIEQIDGGDHA
ncbi:MogA/MoaB family molybdenum cofactor biosynthesis protein [Demequina sediminicola]|uniref:MogA/MoaB family molybdenum cofactor biosynthesis protein n=1 Tax=Demequina sediminicola TaxID=1095026 RepID=UPI000781A87B|nr:MogA/MoaB family molybdenum cofactor biosynthesis protein [Demequina sediminicola]